MPNAGTSFESYIASGLPPIMIPLQQEGPFGPTTDDSTATNDPTFSPHRASSSSSSPSSSAGLVDAQRRRMRTALGFATPKERCEHVAQVMCEDRLQVPIWASRITRHRTAAVQTDNASRRDVGTAHGYAFADEGGSPFHRVAPLKTRTLVLHDLLKLPTAEEFPVMTTSQRMEAARRLTLLLRRIEEECQRVKEEERLLQLEEAVRDPYGAGGGAHGKSFTTQSEWEANMQNAVLQRLELRNAAQSDYAEGPLQWTKQKMEHSLLRPRYQTFVGRDKQRKDVAMAIARAPPLFGSMKIHAVGLEDLNPMMAAGGTTNNTSGRGTPLTPAGAPINNHSIAGGGSATPFGNRSFAGGGGSPQRRPATSR